MAKLKTAWLSWLSLATALRFLTIIPIPGPWPKAQDNPLIQAQSLLFYPLVGLLIGICLITVNLLANAFSDWLSAVLILLAWVIVTGALHIDGLADSADAWLGGHGDKEKTMTILQDTHSGVAAIVAVVLILLLKLILIVELNTNLMIALLLSPIIARTTVIGLFACTPYVRENGIASGMISLLPVRMIWISILAVATVITIWLDWHGMFMIMATMVVVALFRFMLQRRIGGTTGDTAGALIEIIELFILFNLVVIEQLR